MQSKPSETLSTEKVTMPPVQDITADDETGGAQLAMTPEVIALAQKILADRKFKETLDARNTAALGNPNAAIADPYTVKVDARYNVVQNQSSYFLIIPDLKTGPEDMGLTLTPGEHIKLTDFYSPLEINRSKGLRYAATKLKGIGENYALIPLASEEAALAFKVPEKAKHAKGESFDDPNYNDFDARFEELEQKDAKAEERLRKKTLAGRVTKQHGSAPASV